MSQINHLAQVPELAGCKSDGKTYQEALANVQVIIAEWIETANSIGRAIPTPKRKTNVCIIKKSFNTYLGIHH